MAWTSPMTAVANTPFSATQFNIFIRDNLMETAPAKAGVAGSHFTVNTSGRLENRLIQRDYIATAESTSVTHYVNLDTVGPEIEVETGTHALIGIACSIENDTTGATSIMAYAITGATHVDAWANHVLRYDGINGGEEVRSGIAAIHASLTPGINKFTAKYRVGTGEATFSRREMWVLPL